MPGRRAVRESALLVVLAGVAAAQGFTGRGFFETNALLFPQTAPNDSSHGNGAALLRYEAFYKPFPSLQIAGGLDARADMHGETERSVGISWWDRERQRPALAVRRLSATYTRGKLSLEAGKQFIRWGKADVLNPTDRFAPRDYLNVVDNDFLGVTAARLTYGGQTDSLEVVYSPRLTPSRMPLPDQRWSPLPSGITALELPVRFPGGPQVGGRWNHIGRAVEYSLSFYDGHDHLPLFRAQPSRAGLEVQRFYPRMRMYGGDAAAPLPGVTLKGEAAYFTSSTPQADQYALYVLQLERQAGEWFFVGGYAGQVITRHGAAAGFSPARGFTRAFVARAGYTIDVNRSLTLEGVARQNGRGAWLKAEYTQAFGPHWRATAGFAWIRGDASDFLGQFQRNSHGLVALRYSF